MYRIVKRIFDFTSSLLVLLILSPLFLLVMLILRLTDEGNVFYMQERVGLDNRAVNIYKFVTMRSNSELYGSITRKGDPRILPVGKFLRNTKINELPQLLNVLKGELSIVGPRPLFEEGFLLYPEGVQKQIYMDNKPGLTGIGSLFFRSEEEMLENLGEDTMAVYKEYIMPVKGELELWYRREKNLWIDLKIVLLTALSLFVPHQDLHLKAFKTLPISAVEGYKNLRTRISLRQN